MNIPIIKITSLTLLLKVLLKYFIIIVGDNDMDKTTIINQFLNLKSDLETLRRSL